MKTILREMLTMLVLFFIAMGAKAQVQQEQEVVYLKNGSIVKGTIIEQVPNASLKIQTADGSIFAYQMSEVAKIAKEVMPGTKHGSTLNGKGLMQGYRGFIDLGYT